MGETNLYSRIDRLAASSGGAHRIENLAINQEFEASFFVDRLHSDFIGFV